MAADTPTADQRRILLYVAAELAHSDRSLRSICRDAQVGVSPQTIIRWCDTHPELAEHYARAKEQQADYLAEQILEIADDSSQDYKTIERDGEMIEVVDHEHIQRSKLRVDTRKWIAAHLRPKRWGEKLEVEGTVRLLIGLE